MVSIRSKILAGCLALTLLSGVLGVYAQLANRRVGQVGLDIYDNAFMAMSYLRAAQAEFIDITDQAADHPTVVSIDARDDLMDNLKVAQVRAMSGRGRAAANKLRELLAAAIGGSSPGHGLDHAAIGPARAAFDRVVEIYAADGFHYRRRVGSLIAQEQRLGLIIISGILVAALVITVTISHLITPPIRRAVRIAQAIAGGALDNEIVPRGRGETADLLRALATMQTSIATAMARIRALMKDQAASHASEISSRNAQMEAALDNMNQGLCLFGPDGGLLTANRRFGEMFIFPELGMPDAAVLRAAGLEALIGVAGGNEIAAFSCDLADGRSIAVSRQAVAGGGSVMTFEDLSERRRAEAELAHLARHDGLTGLANRLLLVEHLRELEPAEENVAVLSIDLNRFKWVNETLGHRAGDALLCEAAGRLRACVSEGDLIARLGNDEFALVQAGPAQPVASGTLAERILTALHAPFMVDGQPVELGASIGIATRTAVAGAAENVAAPLEGLLKSADLALHRAKAQGTNSYSYFEPEMDTHMQVRRRLEHDLREARARDQLEVFYQPLVKAGVGIAGFEALMRWRHPERGLVNPAVFIPVAEDMGLISEMGGWILRRACLDAAGWPGKFTVAVNLSPMQFRAGRLAEQVDAVLQLSGLDPKRLQLEITEGVLLQDDAHVLETLHAIRALGVRIAMDDFGTGYSSLGYLRRFPFDKIKIDQSFVRHMTEQADCLAIVRAVIGLGRSLGIDINAEGVETEAQMQALLNEGCGELQGFLFSKPRPAAEVRDMLAEQRFCLKPAGRERAITAAVHEPV